MSPAVADALRAVLLAGAVSSLIAGLVALATRKGGDLHRTAGRWFTRLLLAVAAAVLAVGLLDGDVFVVLVTTLSAYLAHSGRREVLRHRAGEAVDARDTGPLVGLLVVAGTLVVQGSRLASEEGGEGALPIAVGFALLLMLLAVTEWRRLGRPPGEHGWLSQHVGAMGVALVTLATTLGAVTHDLWVVPDWVPWLGPTAVGLVVVPRWLAQVRRHGVRATFL